MHIYAGAPLALSTAVMPTKKSETGSAPQENTNLRVVTPVCSTNPNNFLSWGLFFFLSFNGYVEGTYERAMISTTKDTPASAGLRLQLGYIDTRRV